ncbi:hypothetical protein NXV38_21770 [Bacteroides caccae]|nr:hypothetical protein [Bacteroides caccae]
MESVFRGNDTGRSYLSGTGNRNRHFISVVIGHNDHIPLVLEALYGLCGQAA